MGLIQKFEERLEVSRNNAVFRVFAFLVCCALFVAVLAFAALNFPYAGAYTEKVALLPGNHIQVKEILDGEVLVDKENFLRIAAKNESFVALGDKAIVYMTKPAGVSYRYNQLIPLRNDYFVSSQKIEDGMAVREIKRSLGMTVYEVFLGLIVLFVLFVLGVYTQTRQVSGWGSSATYKNVWA